MSQPDSQNLTAAEASRIYFLPSLFTAGNLFFGFVAVIRCIQAKNGEYNPEIDTEMVFRYYREAVWCIFLAFVCDALDGRVARLGGKESLFGKEFDSIADVVSFGMAPALMVFFLILSPTEAHPLFRRIGWLIGFVYLLCAAIRLARFNVITHPLLPRPATGVNHLTQFLGLPVPVAAGLIASLVLVMLELDIQNWSLGLPWLMLLVAWLMVSHIPYPSFKKIDWHTQTSVRLFVLLVICILITFFVLKDFAFAALFLAYILYGPTRYILKKCRKSPAS